MKAGREVVVQARTRQQALDELASLCKTVYEKTFGKVVDRINQALDKPKDHQEFIGVLDIAGFEIFEVRPLVIVPLLKVEVPFIDSGCLDMYRPTRLSSCVSTTPMKNFNR